jgi:beta-glucosidase-like glycosyl hydrolase
MASPVQALGEQTSLSERKRRAGQRLLLGISEPNVCDDLRALLRELQPAGFVLQPSLADEPAQLLELSAELASRLPPGLPPVLAARHERGAACPGCVDLPPPGWLARIDDPGLSRRLGRVWRRELAALGFHLQLGPRCELEPLAGEPLPGLEPPLEPLLFGPSLQPALRNLGAFSSAEEAEACAACPSLAPGALRDGRLVAWEKDLPGLLAEELRLVEAAVAARVPALLVGWGRWPAFDEERPCWSAPSLLAGQLRERLGFGGLLLAEDPGLAPEAERLPREPMLCSALEAGLDLWLLQPGWEAQLSLYEALVRLQERHPGLTKPLEDAARRLLRGRERLMLHRRRPGLEVLDGPEHRDLALLVRVRGA